MEILGSEHVVGHVALVNIHVAPLSALSFMTRDGVCIFHLQGIVVNILSQSLKTICLQRYMLIVLRYIIVHSSRASVQVPPTSAC